MSEIPKGVEDIGVISNAVRWTDSLGINILITTKKDIRHQKQGETAGTWFNKSKGWISSKESENSTNLILARPSHTLHYFVKNDSAILNWQVMGIIKNCNDDNLNLSKNWFVITDLDKDRMAESWVIYKSVCPQDHGDDTGIIKIFMYENAIRSTISTTLEQQSFNEGAMDHNFKSTPEIIRKYAAELWKKFATMK